jgi:hypothetical protein
MTSGEDFGAPPARPRIRIRFSLLALLIFITLACLLLAYLAQPRRVVATALFQVDSSAPLSLDSNQPRALGERELEILKKTQLALLKSNYVLTAAIRPPGIASLPVLQVQRDPVAWLQDNLKVEFPRDGEILSISLSGTEGHQQDLVRIVDAVAKAYQEEVIEKERQRRLNNRDLLARNFENLSADTKRKMDEFLDIAREAGKLDDGSAQVRQQIEMKRLDRIEDELIRLESEQAGNGDSASAKSKSMDERIKQLGEQRSELEKSLAQRAEKSTDLDVRRRELDQLQRISDEMSMRLQRLDLEASAPSQIQSIQPAVVAPQ